MGEDSDFEVPPPDDMTESKCNRLNRVKLVTKTFNVAVPSVATDIFRQPSQDFYQKPIEAPITRRKSSIANVNMSNIIPVSLPVNEEKLNDFLDEQDDTLSGLLGSLSQGLSMDDDDMDGISQPKAVKFEDEATAHEALSSKSLPNLSSTNAPPLPPVSNYFDMDSTTLTMLRYHIRDLFGS
jgi:hypothetical protein